MASTIDDLTEATKCINLLGDREKLAALVWYMLNEAVACGSVASTDIDTLITDSRCWQFNKELSQSVEVALACQAAVAQGADTISCTDIDALATAIKCLKLKDEEALRGMVLYLRDQLNDCL